GHVPSVRPLRQGPVLRLPCAAARPLRPRHASPVRRNRWSQRSWWSWVDLLRCLIGQVIARDRKADTAGLGHAGSLDLPAFQGQPASKVVNSDGAAGPVHDRHAMPMRGIEKPHVVHIERNVNVQSGVVWYRASWGRVIGRVATVGAHAPPSADVVGMGWGPGAPALPAGHLEFESITHRAITSWDTAAAARSHSAS